MSLKCQSHGRSDDEVLLADGHGRPSISNKEGVCRMTAYFVLSHPCVKSKQAC